MNAQAFRHLYGYHFTENRKLWEVCTGSLSRAQLSQPASYSHGSIWNQIVHLISVEDTWFCGLRGVDIPEPLDPDAFEDLYQMRAYWDAVEKDMHAYLAGLQDETLFQKPFADGEDQDLIVWQVLLHVVNHGTDHRAQVLRSLSDLGVKTDSQDYIFYAYDHGIKDETLG
jgi:uncharacterized damage-inducible protein DinB